MGLLSIFERIPIVDIDLVISWGDQAEQRIRAPFEGRSCRGVRQIRAGATSHIPHSALSVAASITAPTFSAASRSGASYKWA